MGWAERQGFDVDAAPGQLHVHTAHHRQERVMFIKGGRHSVTERDLLQPARNSADANGETLFL